MQNSEGIGSVLSGQKAIRVDIGIDTKSAVIGGLVIFTAVLLVVIISKKI